MQPKWKIKEQLVAALEKSLSSEAVVEHDVKLAILGQPGKWRQFDVVIRLGKPPREQILTVEVQDRSRPVNIDQVRAWLAKMEEVGGHGLVCVSKAGFEGAVKYEVSHKLGPRVRLLTLTDADSSAFSWQAFTLVPTLVRINFDILDLIPRAPDYVLERVGELITVNLGDCRVSNSPDEEGKELINWVGDCISAKDPLSQLSLEAIGKPVHVTLEINAQEVPLWLHFLGHHRQIKNWVIDVVIVGIQESMPIDFSKWEYRQEGFGSVAWIAVGTVATNPPVQFTFIALPKDDGQFGISVGMKYAI
jgi:hypothetical protein